MIELVGARARDASKVLAQAKSHVKNHALGAASTLLLDRASEICNANEADLEQAADEGISGALVDRLRLTSARIKAMADGMQKIRDLADPIGQVTFGATRPNGLRLRRVRVPLGVVAVIYEARPNVTADSAALCIKSGNAVLLRGSSYALNSNRSIGLAIREAIEGEGLPADSVQVIEDTTRESARALMQAREWIDLLVPRGGPGLIAAIESEATVPYVIDGLGNCHIYVDAEADLDMAAEISVNAKTQRPGVCNAAEKLLVHEAVAAEFLPKVAKLLADAGVELRGDERTREIVDGVIGATEEDWATEYLDLIMAIKVVNSVEEALSHISRFGSGHTEAIVTSDLGVADRFVAGTESAVVMVNASTRFTDGEEFGFGAEIGISTQKLHVRGPIGLEALTSERWVVHGDGHVR